MSTQDNNDEYVPTEEELREIEVKQQAAIEARIESDAERREREAAEAIEKERQRVEANNAALKKQLAAADKERKKTNAEIGKTVEYDEFLADNGLKHFRQHNEAHEDYEELTPGVERDEKPVYNDGSLDGEFGKPQRGVIEHPETLDEIIERERREREEQELRRMTEPVAE